MLELFLEFVRGWGSSVRAMQKNGSDESEPSRKLRLSKLQKEGSSFLEISSFRPMVDCGRNWLARQALIVLLLCAPCLAQQFQPNYLNASITVTNTGLVQIVAAVSGQSIRVQTLFLSLATAETIQLEYGTGTNCGTGTTAITPAMPAQSLFSMNLAPGPLILPAGQALCIQEGAMATAGGFLIYTQY